MPIRLRARSANSGTVLGERNAIIEVFEVVVLVGARVQQLAILIKDNQSRFTVLPMQNMTNALPVCRDQSQLASCGAL